MRSGKNHLRMTTEDIAFFDKIRYLMFYQPIVLGKKQVKQDKEGFFYGLSNSPGGREYFNSIRAKRPGSLCGRGLCP